MRRWSAARKRLLLTLALLLVHGGARAADAPRVVSINLCSDQLLLALADPGQILGLSPYATDPLRSFEAEKARRFPRLSGTAEEIVALRPDLVLAGRFTRRATRELVRTHGFRLAELDSPRSIEDAKSQIREVATLLGHPARGEAAVARIDAAIASARSVAAAGSPTVLPLQRRGWVAGGGTLLTSLLDVVGLRNAGASFSPGYGRQVGLEAIVQLRPDKLLVSGEERRAEDQGSALLQHPALDHLYPARRRIVLPERFNATCGGPGLADAIERLAAQLRKPDS